MYSLFSHAPFTDQLIKALCWTLIHSLWQGLIFAIVAASMIQLTKKSGSVVRYHLLSAILFLFVVTAMITFCSELKSRDNSQPISQVVKVASPRPIITTVSSRSININNYLNHDSLVAKCTDFLNEHAMLIVLCWFVFFCAKSGQMLLNIGYIQKIRFNKTQAPSVFWTDKIKELSGRLGIKRMVLILESGVIKVPVVVGFLKPVILLPLGLLANLPAEEIEAILLHELAHIQRNDYFINLVQRFIEVVFFFNPALLWISSLIKEERENCCDDIAITVTNNKAKFIQALISFQEYNTAAPAYSMAFGNGREHLLNRVKRIILNKNKTLNTMEKILFAGSIAAIVFFSFSPVKKVFTSPVTQNGVKELSSFHNVKSSSTQYLPINNSYQPSLTTGLGKNGKTIGRNTFEVMDTLPIPSAPQSPATKPSVPSAPQTPATKPSVPSAPQTPATKPSAPQIPALIPGASQNETSDFFSSINRKGAKTTINIEATGKDGKKYKINKINNTIIFLSVNGVKIDDEHLDDYRGIIDKMEADANKHINETAKSNRKLNDIRQEMQQKKNEEEMEIQLKKINFERINLEVKEALAKVDFNKIAIETEKAMKNVDWDKIKINVEQSMKEARLQIKNIDTKKIKKQIEEAQEKLKNENGNIKIDKEKINKQVEEALRNARQQIEKAKTQNYKIDKQVKEALRNARVTIQNAKSQNYKVDKQVEEALHIDQIQIKGEPE